MENSFFVSCHVFLLPIFRPMSEVVGMHFAMVDDYHIGLLHSVGKQLHAWWDYNLEVL